MGKETLMLLIEQRPACGSLSVAGLRDPAHLAFVLARLPIGALYPTC